MPSAELLFQAGSAGFPHSKAAARPDLEIDCALASEGGASVFIALDSKMIGALLLADQVQMETPCALRLSAQSASALYTTNAKSRESEMTRDPHWGHLHRLWLPKLPSGPSSNGLGLLHLNIYDCVMGVMVNGVSNVISLQPDQIKDAPQLNFAVFVKYLVIIEIVSVCTIILIDAESKSSASI